MGGVGHGLGAAGNDDVGVAGDDRLGTENDGLQSGGADLVDGCAGDGFGEATADGALAGWGLAEAGWEDIVSFLLFLKG